MTTYLDRYRKQVKHALQHLELLPDDRDVPVGVNDELVTRGRYPEITVNAINEVLDYLAAADQYHVLKIEKNSWGLQHPIKERLTGDLFECEAGMYMSTLPAAPVPPGTYRMYEAHGAWELFLIPEEES